MNAKTLWRRISHSLTSTPFIAAAVAVGLLLASLGLALHNEQLARTDQVHRAQVQARILAGSVAAPLAFDDPISTREYIDALRANPEIEAVGAYDAKGQLASGYDHDGEPLPRVNQVGPTTFKGGDLIVTEPVAQDGARLGSVYIRMATESWARRVTRYLGIAVVIVMASMLIAVLGASYASLNAAHRRLRQATEGRRKAEEALRQAQKMEAMGQLVGGVAHDFNNLLMVASSGLDLMDRTPDPLRREKLKQGIRQAVDRGAKLTQQLLAFARQSPLNPEVIDLGARIRGMHDLLDRSLREDVVVQIEVAERLWPVEVDPSQLEVAVLNIALNARDAMPNGGKIVISVENEPGPSAGTGGHVRLSIKDAGVGMPANVLSKVFEPFFTTKSVGQGTGLGLSQVYGFARSSGGEVDIESVVGVGTTVSLRLPRSTNQNLAQDIQPQKTPVVARRRHRVLLVEDDDQLASLVEQMLDELGYDASRAPNAATALDMLRADLSLDLVFSDMVMPGDMNGLDLAHEIAARRPDLPVVLTTGYSSAANSAAAEGVRLLVKPYRMDVLATELAAALAERDRPSR